MRSSRAAGKRSDIARVESLTLGNRARRPLLQSRYCVESRPGTSQKARSAASDANSGTRLRGFLIDSPFFPVHRARLDDADPRAVGAKRERDVELPPLAG